MPLPRIPEAHTLDFRQANWICVNEDLAQRLESDLPAMRIKSQNEFTSKVNDLVRIIKEVLGDHLKERRLSPFICRWWTKELTQLKKQQNKLSTKSYKMRHICDHPAHAEYKVATVKFRDVMKETRSQDWTDWLEATSQQDLYIANKYISNKPSDYSNAHLPSLRTTTNNLPSSADDNTDKAKALTKLFFPPPLAMSHVPQNVDYPQLLKGIRFFSRARIRQVICMLSPYKAPEPDQIPNVILIKYCDVLIDHLFFIFRAVFEHDVYHP